MRYRPVVFLALLAAHGAPHHRQHHHPMPYGHMGLHDGGSPRDFNRTLNHLDKTEFHFVQRRFDRIDLGNGAKLGVGFIGGHHMGLKLKLPL
ncbi:MAG TPA: hypothetical protein VH331_17570 [Allosphingosinicella sp.]|jgi:hypothetical protein|nr:hypothetical protein [Allosphingosinicella sp.]